MHTLEQLLQMAGARITVAPDPDEYGVVRWQPGLLPILADEMGAGALLQAVGRAKPMVADLPDWFRFPVNLTAGTLVQPAFDFLRSDVLARKEAARSTSLARAYDLKAYFAFLARCETPWTDVDQATVDEFTLDMVSSAIDRGLDPSRVIDGGGDIDGIYGVSDEEDAAVVDLRSQPLAQSTVRRRLSTVQCFHAYASPGHAPFDVRGAMKAGRRPNQTVRPITREDLSRLVDALGPPPSQRTVGSSRLWVAVMLALVAGLRRMEVCGLDAEQFDRPLDPGQPEREHCLRLVKTKGGAARDVIAPTWLLLEIRAYIEGERKSAQRGEDDPSPSLLLNHPSSQRAPRCRLMPETLSFDFRRLMLSSGMKRRLTGFRLGRGDSNLPHTFHDLRHTCACLTFVQMKGRCTDPWLAVQTTLGHKLLATTKAIYLRYVNEFDGASADMRQSLVRGLLAA